MSRSKKGPALQRFILLPTRGLKARQPTSSPAVRSTLMFLSERLANPAAPEPSGFEFPKTNLRVIDSIHEDGAKLVEMSAETASELRASQPGLRIVAIVYYYPAVAPRHTIAATTKSTKAGTSLGGFATGPPRNKLEWD